MFLHIVFLNSFIKCKSRHILNQITIYQTSDEGLISYALNTLLNLKVQCNFYKVLIKDLLGQERTKKRIIRVEIRKVYEKRTYKILTNIEAMFNSYY